MPDSRKKTKIGMFEILDILNLRASGADGPSVADLILRQCRPADESADAPAYLLEIDGSYVDVYEVEGEPLHITMRYAAHKRESDQTTLPKQAAGGNGSEYTFKAISLTHPSTIQAHDAFALKVVAIAGSNDDWAAYEGPSNWPDEKIVRQGNKLLQEQAEPLFYVMRACGRRYGDPRQQPEGDDSPDYTFKNKVMTRPWDVQDKDAFAMKIVAVAGHGDDWAAYEGPSDWSDEEVARRGDKLEQEQAEPLFPVMCATARYYRM